ncbi:hypothetical protein NE237_030168 [Protea cynaroides]|uniref:Uncharacterized protein n=1 Tax=Protea cynaroides TaxID=273540 RepID=A0A9Q0GUJ6_9MAGN|nr:hypothetical protein NE237_030168 [Protea cynaroides]
MRCKRHSFDASSGVGICASCLRERLVIIIAAQTRQQALAQAQVEAEERRKSDAHPPPIIFPRSVSPYIYRRSTSEPSWEHHHQFDQRFYSTPQLGPTSYHTTVAGSVHKKKQSKFSLFASLFGKFRSQEPESEGTDPRVSRGSRSSSATSTSSSPISQISFSALFPSHRKKISRFFSLEGAGGRGHRVCSRKDRGMSPARDSDEDEHYGDSDDSSGFWSKSPPNRGKQGLQVQATPPQTTPTRCRRRGYNRSVSGLAVCFSPLVRPSPSSHHHRNVGFSGDIRASSKQHLSTVASLGKNGSRKLADIGRYKSFNL